MIKLNVFLSAFLFLLVGCSKQYVGVKKIDKIPVDPSYSGEKVVNHLLEGHTSDEDFVEIMNNVEYQFNRKDFWFHARNKLVIDEPWIYKIFKFRPVCEKGDGSDLIETSSYFADYLVKQTNFFFSTNNIDVNKILRNLDNISYVFKECEIKNRNDVFLLFSQDEWGMFFSNITSNKITKSLNKNQYERYFDFMLTVLSLKVEDLKLVESKDSSILVLRDLFSKFPWDLVHEKLSSCKPSDSSCVDNYSIVRMKDHDIPRVFYREYYDADSEGYEGRNSILNRKDMLLKFLLYKDESEVEVAYEKLFNYIPDTNRSGIVLDFLQQSILNLSSGQQAFTFALLNDSFKDQHPKEVYELGLKVFNNINGTSSLNESVSIMNFLKEIGNKDVVNCSDSNSLKLYQDTLNNISSSSALPFSAEDKNIIESLVSLAMDLKIRCKELVDFPSEAVLKVVLEKGVISQDLEALISDGVFNQQADIILAAMLPEDFKLQKFIDHLKIFSAILQDGNDLNELFVQHIVSDKKGIIFRELIGKEKDFVNTGINYHTILEKLSQKTGLDDEAVKSYDLFLASYLKEKDDNKIDLKLFSMNYPLPVSAGVIKVSYYRWDSVLLERVLLNPLLINLFNTKEIADSVNDKILLADHREKYALALGRLLNYTKSGEAFLNKLISLKDEGHMTFLALIMKNALIISNNNISYNSALPELDKHIVGIVLGDKKDRLSNGDIKKQDQEWMTHGLEDRIVTVITRNECIEENAEKSCLKWNATKTQHFEKFFRYGNFRLNKEVNRRTETTPVTVVPADILLYEPDFKITFSEENIKNSIIARKEKLSVVGIYYPYLNDIPDFTLKKFSGYTSVFMKKESLEPCVPELQDKMKSELRNFSRCFSTKNDYFKSAVNEVGLVLEFNTKDENRFCAVKDGVKSYCLEEDAGEPVLKVLKHNISFFEVMKLPIDGTEVRVDKSAFDGVEPLAYNARGELITFIDN